MAERPILFQPDMIRALLDGRKTMTRRVVKPQPYCNSVGQWLWKWKPKMNEVAFWPDINNYGPLPKLCPYGQPGDLLWAREAWALSGSEAEARLRDYNYPELLSEYLVYRATADGYDDEVQYWRPSIHMPRWASRLTLKITDVRVERVQDISGDDCIAEGVGHPVGSILRYGSVTEVWNRDRCFAPLWDSINAKRGYSWESNPWVWVISFDVINMNIDQYLKEQTDD